jgi:hypothetical protein
MSGGSYEYLFAKDIDDLLHNPELRNMADRLAGLGYARDAAAETEELILLLRQFQVRVEVRVKRLADVWKAVEWWDSRDSGEDAVKEALKKYRGD